MERTKSEHSFKRKKRAAMAIFTVSLIFISAAIYYIPHFVIELTPNAKLVYPSTQRISKDIYADGLVEQQSKKDIIAEIPIVPDEVMVDIGDYVKKGDVIASIDKEATKAAIFSMIEAVNLIPAEYVEVLGNLSMSVPESFISQNIPTGITAAADGVITSISLVKGAISTPKAVVCTISNVDEIRLNMSVGEMDANEVCEGDVVTFSATAVKDKEFSGVVTKVFPVASKVVSGTSQKTVVGIYVKPDEVYSELKPGYSVEGTIIKDSEQAALMLPYAALEQDENNVEYVYCYENSKAVRKDVKTGEEYENGVVISGGVTEHDAVILNIQDVKSNNSYVRIVE